MLNEEGQRLIIHLCNNMRLLDPFLCAGFDFPLMLARWLLQPQASTLHTMPPTTERKKESFLFLDTSYFFI